jgi:hypothetical protein
VHDFPIPDQLVADALAEPTPEPEPEPSPEPPVALVPVIYFDTPKLVDAIRPPMPPKGNRRARRAAAKRARQGR